MDSIRQKRLFCLYLALVIANNCM